MTASALDFEVEPKRADDGAEDLTLATGAGDIRCRLHRAKGANAGVVWAFGAGGGLGGPAGGVYERLARQLQPEGVTSLQVDYRRPGQMKPCVEDMLTGVAFVASLGVERLAVVGHSFGGAVAINAGAASRDVVAVAALSSQSYGAEGVVRLSPKPLLLIHGEEDEVLPAASSLQLYAVAGQPKQLILYPRCLHGLDQCRDDLDRDVCEWLLRVFHLV